MSLSFRQISCAAAALSSAVSPLVATVAAAQTNPPPQQGYRDPLPPQDDRYEQGYRDGQQQAYQNAPPQGDDEAPPPGYDGSQPPPPPPGYHADAAYDGDRSQDQRYEAYAEDWAQRNCVKSHGNTAAGAVIGGLFGALIGSSIAGRHDRGAGAFVGGVAGAAGGAAIGSSADNATSPGCPPGYSVRGGAPAFYYDDGPYYYAAPGWYRPWVFYEGRWAYRPYPYHGWYYRNYHHRGPGPYYRGGYGRYHRRHY